MRLIIRDDADATSAYVANYIIDRIKAFNPTPQNPFVLGLPTGSSPLGVYKYLVQMYKAGEVRKLPLCHPTNRAQNTLLSKREIAFRSARDILELLKC